ncbi:TPA: DUF2591 family protein [Morganella morganii]|nr:DUF2591 family protein [Morganella morganii]HCR3762655.1 DUF2591 family protein [Morganella morganii]
MNKYRDKSDFEINKAVAVYLGYTAEYENKSVTVFRNNNGGMPLVVSATADSSDNFDPCNKPVNAMPIIIENGICMAYDAFSEWCDGGSWIAQPAYGFFDEWARSDNYYRAAMICFLMMKDAENETNT